jgi:hypothetical protein
MNSTSGKKYDGWLAAGYLLLFIYLVALRPAPVEKLVQSIQVDAETGRLAALAQQAREARNSPLLSALWQQFMRYATGEPLSPRLLLTRNEAVRFSVGPDGDSALLRGEITWQVRGGLLGKLLDRFLGVAQREEQLAGRLRKLRATAERGSVLRFGETRCPAPGSYRPQRREASPAARGFRAVPVSCPDTFNRDLAKPNGTVALPRDPRHQVQATYYAAENRVLAGEPERGDLGDEELAAVGVWAGVGHGQQPGAIELQLPNNLVNETITRAAGAVAKRIAALNHEFRDHPVKDRPIVERPRGALPGDGIGPLPGAGGKPDEVGDGGGRLPLEQLADDISFRGVEGGVDPGPLRPPISMVFSGHHHSRYWPAAPATGLEPGTSKVRNP